MRILCGQCGTIQDLDGPVGPFAVCSACKHEISLVDKPDGNGAAVPAVNGAKAAFMKDPYADGGFAEQARKAKHRKISITCSACGKTVHLSARVAGKTARCKACGEDILVPYPDDFTAIKLPSIRPRPDETVQGEELLPGPKELAGQEAPAPAPEPVAVTVAVLEGEPVVPGELDIGQREDVVGALDEYAADLDAGYNANQGELASVLADLQQETAAMGRVPPARKADRRGKKTLYLAAGAVAVLVPVIAVFTVMKFLRPNQADKGPGGDANSANNVAVATPPVDPPPTTNVVVTTRRVAPVASCTVLDSLTSAFAAGGYFPARSDSLYTQIKVRLQAGERPLRLQPGVNTDFVLAVNGRDIPCLGTPVATDEGLPQRSRTDDVRLPAEGSRELVLLFEIPRDAAEGTLKVRDLGETKTPFDGAPSPIPVARLAGTYLECPPRNLRPLLRHPVMAAIQAAVGQRLIVKPEGNDLRVEVPEAAVTGLARRAGPGLFRATLSCGGADLACTLRFLGGGSMVLLYLDEAPFHQITYSRTGLPPASPTPKTVTPSIGAGTRPPEREPGPPGYDPNARPDSKEARDLPRKTKSWFDFK